MKGPDNKLRNCYPVLFSVAMDYPEACMFTLVRTGNACPVCVAPQAEFDDLSQTFVFRDPLSMSTALEEARLYDDKSMKTDLQKIGLVDMEVSESTILEMDVGYRSTFSYFYFHVSTHSGIYPTITYTRQSPQTCFTR